MTKTPSPARFTNIRLTPDGRGFEGERAQGKPGAGTIRFSASFDLFLIKEAWLTGCDFEAEADGFGAGEGTLGDWSAIRDSSEDAQRAMLEKALNHLFPHLFPE